VRGGFTTDPAHRPDSHRRYAQWTPSRLIRWAEKIGPATAAVIAEVLRRRPHPEQGFRSCLGIMSLAKRYSPERLELACRRAQAIASPSYRSVLSILKNSLDQQPLPSLAQLNEAPPLRHDNIRGPEYYQQKGAL
jgi:transposase